MWYRGLITLWLITVTSAIDTEIFNKILGSETFDSIMTILTISNEKMEDIMKVVKSKDIGLLIKGVTKTIKNKTKIGFLVISLGYQVQVYCKIC